MCFYKLFSQLFDFFFEIFLFYDPLTNISGKIIIQGQIIILILLKFMRGLEVLFLEGCDLLRLGDLGLTEGGQLLGQFLYQCEVSLFHYLFILVVYLHLKPNLLLHTLPLHSLELIPLPEPHTLSLPFPHLLSQDLLLHVQFLIFFHFFVKKSSQSGMQLFMLMEIVQLLVKTFFIVETKILFLLDAQGVMLELGMEELILGLFCQHFLVVDLGLFLLQLQDQLGLFGLDQGFLFSQRLNHILQMPKPFPIPLILNLQPPHLFLPFPSSSMLALQHSLRYLHRKGILQHGKNIFLGFCLLEIVYALGFDVEVCQEFACLHFQDYHCAIG